MWPANRAPLLGLIVAVAAVLAGCRSAIGGDWRLQSATPSRELFCIEDATFRKDGAYAATVTLDGRTQREAGTYAFTGFHLTLRPSAGGQRRYEATLKLSELEVRREGAVVVLVRGKSRSAATADPPAAAGRPARKQPPPHAIREGRPPDARDP